MERRLIECVANYSEGRDASVISALAAELRGVPGTHLLHQTSDQDHNRTVLTFAGHPEPVAEAAFRSVRRAAELIDLNRHQGVHPRIGSADVVPFVPLEGQSLEDCAALARRFGVRVWNELGIPVYLYEAAALRPERRDLAVIRRGGFERLREDVRADPGRRPDFGGLDLHPTAGATVTGARKILVAFNILLRSSDADLARRIARKIRASSGGLACVKALGVLLASRGLAQVSMNLTDYQVTPPRVVFDAVEAEAAREGVEIQSSEVIGLIPRPALEPGGPEHLRIENFSEDMILENRLATIR